ncbi:helix-turn-helix domain-containing protein [Lederbergia wuyishanensis]|uniref:Transcriptional regulator with XRE-family HTH domain/thiamine kinase-like enzyme n=1 Tax=Lederbergia wuyishanensis TaxID=1347903 RepID=A0ABU0D541_9BACI|nr:helix-turn-helix domain-containing protein [Lederbergia wuyishanensis]MCJ8009612.1 helix-turn-helix domain-containing protein [Lederbergia wuyishanensis]MDQ0343520.1 transcriptional regulator with XRE-family HTH domain/thiamine kinase-like enzyme [Lederbergia wuyishanensis]
MNIGEKLKLRRKKAGFTQEQVAEKLNITRQTLSNWEVGKYYPDIDSIIALSQIYQLSLDELLLGKIYFKGALPMAKKLSEMEIQRIVTNHYPNGYDFKELSGGLVSQTYSFNTEISKYVFQVGNRPEVYEKEKWVYNHYNHLLPLRNVLKVEVEDGVAYSISNYIEGKKLFDLNSQELLDIVPSIMKTLEILESIEVTEQNGYGRYDNNGHGAYPTWEDFIKAVYNEKIYNWAPLERNGLDSSVVTNALQKLKSHINSISIGKKNMIHGDLGSFNLLAENGKITGIIDWSLSLYGDHLYDKANILFWNEDKLQPLIQQIRNKYIDSPEAKEKVYCYMLRIGLEEIYNTVILNEVGYDIEWVANRLQKITDTFL